MSTALRHDPHGSQLDELYRELRPDLLRFAEGMLGSRHDAEEAVQEAFAVAARSFAGGPPADPRPWLFRVTRNAAIDQIRRRRMVVSLDGLPLDLPNRKSTRLNSSHIQKSRMPSSA